MAVTPANTNTHISENFAKLLEPGLRKIFFQTYAEVPEQFSKFYKMNTSKKAKEYDHTMGAFGDWEKRVSELSNVSYAKISDGWDITYTHEAFTKGFMVGRELVDDELYRQINKMPAALARAGRAFVEKKAAETFIHAFGNINGAVGSTYTIFDGKALIASDHPLKDSTKVCSNVASGELNDANLKAALTLMRETVDEAGNIIGINPKRLIVPPELEFKAKTLVNSTQTAGTNNNDINAIKGALEVCVYDYIGGAAGGSDTMWFLQDPDLHELNFFWRVKPEFKADEDFDTYVAKYRGYMRFSYGVSDWRGMCGSIGTPSATPAVTRPANAATTVAVGTCVNGANLALYVNDVNVASAVANSTSHSFTGLTAVATGDKIFVLQTESGKAPVASTTVTV